MPAAFVANDVEAELDAARAGLGIGLIDSLNGAADVGAVGRDAGEIVVARRTHSFHVMRARRLSLSGPDRWR